MSLSDWDMYCYDPGMPLEVWLGELPAKDPPIVHLAVNERQVKKAIETFYTEAASPPYLLSNWQHWGKGTGYHPLMACGEKKVYVHPTKWQDPPPETWPPLVPPGPMATLKSTLSKKMLEIAEQQTAWMDFVEHPAPGKLVTFTKYEKPKTWGEVLPTVEQLELAIEAAKKDKATEVPTLPPHIKKIWDFTQDPQHYGGYVEVDLQKKTCTCKGSKGSLMCKHLQKFFVWKDGAYQLLEHQNTQIEPEGWSNPYKKTPGKFWGP